MDTVCVFYVIHFPYVERKGANSVKIGRNGTKSLASTLYGNAEGGGSGLSEFNRGALISPELNSGH